MDRKSKIENSSQLEFDLIVVGGGITGAGVLKEAAQNGLKTLLIEKNDFGSGTSSKSAKLVHGGLRYLQNFQFGVVKESLRERNWLLEEYSHIVKPLEFVYPLYQSGLKFRIGMILYQMMGKHKNLPKYKFLKKEEVLQNYPAINAEGLKGGFSYYDGLTNDSGLVSEIIFESSQYQDIVALNYLEVVKINESGNTSEVKCRDNRTGEEHIFKSKVVVNCTGPWTDETINLLDNNDSKMMAPSKGVHIIFSTEKLNIKSAFAFSSGADDGRMFYALPWEFDTVIVGVTDTAYKGSPDEVYQTEADISYLLNGLNKFSPSSNFTFEDIQYSFAGLRPLFNEKGPSKNKTRDFKIWWDSKNLVSLSGGKLTTFRAMAKSLMNELVSTEKIAMSQVSKSIPERRTISNCPDHILTSYSKDSMEIISSIIEESNENKQPIIKELDIVKAEIIFAIRHLGAMTVEDIMLRRFSFRYGMINKPYYSTLVSKIGSILQEELDWNSEQLTNEVTQFIDSKTN